MVLVILKVLSELLICSPYMVGKEPTQMKKFLKFQLLAEIFWIPRQFSKKRSYQQKCHFFVPNSNYKPHPTPKKAEPHRFHQLRSPLMSLNVEIMLPKVHDFNQCCFRKCLFCSKTLKIASKHPQIS